jgi:phenylalanyl-tRNA synthetase beta chain
MRVPLSWLSEHVDIRLPAEELADVLSLGGLEVEDVLRPTAGVRGVVVAEVRALQPVAGSDKLHRAVVFDGTRDWEILAGASNFAAGDRVAAALPGATLPGGVEIGARRMMGLVSNGMLASARELGLGDDHRGIWVLGQDAPLGADLAEWLDLDDAVLDIAVTPDRGYAMSIRGIARDLAALTGAELRLPPRPQVALPEDPPGDLVTLLIADGERCHRFTATEVRGVRVGPSPAWLQRRLAAVGVRPISNVVDATNYAMFETGHPVHAYDRAKVAGPLLEVRDARQGETVVTLDGVQRRLDLDDLVIGDAQGVVGLAGVMGGAGTEVGPETNDLIIEVASFDAASVLRTARRHKLFTEASTRFEKVVPDATAAFGADRCVELLTALAGGTGHGRADLYPAPRPLPGVALRPERVRGLLGVDVPDERQAEILEALGCDVRPAGEVLAVLPPPFRPDLRGEADLAEEIARIDGYDRIPETLPAPVRPGGRSPEHLARTAVRHALAGAGWDEMLTFPFVADTDLDALGLPEDDPRRRPVALENPLSKEETALRTTLLPGLFRVVRRNVNRQSTDLAVFEVGHAFLPPTPEEPGADGGPEGVRLPAEPLLLALAASGAFARERWDAPPQPADLGDLLGAVDVVRRALGRSEVRATATDERPYHPGRAARLAVDGMDVGVVGELHPRVLAAFGLPPRTLAGELRLDRLVAGGVRPPRTRTPSPLPSLRVDVAAVVDDRVPAADVEAAVRAGAGGRLSELTLFDVYRGPPLPEGQKNLAYRLRLDDPEHQLSAEDGQAVLDAVESALAERVGGSIRR